MQRLCQSLRYKTSPVALCASPSPEGKASLAGFKQKLYSICDIGDVQYDQGEI